VIQDGGPANASLHTGVENYKELFYSLVGLAGEGQSFDGNGSYVRLQVGGGPFTFSTGPSSLTGDKLFGNAVLSPLGTRPKFPGKLPPYNSSFPCYRNPLPDLNGPASEPGPPPTAIGEGLASRADAPVSGASAKPDGRAVGAGRADSLVDQLLARLNPFPGGRQAGSGQGGRR
jgi:hypothetical protein